MPITLTGGMVLSGCRSNNIVELVNSLYTESIAVSSFSQAVPSGNSGDLLLLIVVSPNSITLPSGWTSLFGSFSTMVCYKSASTVSESNFTVSITGPNNCGSAIYRFSGASTALVAGATNAFNYNPTGTVGYQAISGGVGSDYYLQWVHATNASANFSIPTTSIGALLVDNNATAPSFASFFSIGVGSAKSSNFTQPTTGVLFSGQIRIPALYV